MKKRFMLVASLLMVIFSGCSIKGVTEPFESESKNEGVGDDVNYLPDETKNIDDEVSDEQINDVENGVKVKYEVGEPMPALTQRGSKASDLETYVTITVTNASICNGIENTGIDQAQFNELCEIYPNFDIYPRSMTIEQYKNAKILMLDIHVKVEDWYIEEKTKEGNITEWHLSYVKEDDSYVSLGYPCYFSNSLTEDYYTMDLSEKEFDVKVGYIIDEELLEVEKVDVSKLIYNIYGCGVFFKYIELFPNVK